MDKREIIDRLDKLNTERQKLINLLRPFQEKTSPRTYSTNELLETAKKQFDGEYGIIKKQNCLYVFHITDFVITNNLNICVNAEGIVYSLDGSDNLGFRIIYGPILISKKCDKLKNEVVFTELTKVVYINKALYDDYSITKDSEYAKLQLATQAANKLAGKFVHEYITTLKNDSLIIPLL